MLTDDKKITTPEYWGKVYSGQNLNAKVDSSNTPRPAKPFDRFQIVVDQVTVTIEGNDPSVLDIGSGHAHICKRLKTRFPQGKIVASDQTREAMKVAKFQPYFIFDGYNIPFQRKSFDYVICTQAMEYMEWPHTFLMEAKAVADRFICTVPDGEMGTWSQLRIYSEETLRTFLAQYGTIEVLIKYPGLILAKIKFHKS